MLRLTADVNGHTIGYLFIHNTGRKNKAGEHLYNAALWQPEIQDGVFGFEEIPHPRPEGWAMLALRVLRKAFGDAR